MTYDYACKCGTKTAREECMVDHGKEEVKCARCGETMTTVITGGMGTFFLGVGWARDSYASHGIATDYEY